MNTCKKYSDQQWLAYLLNRTEEQTRIEMQYHLSECVACREQMKRIRSLQTFLEDSGEEAIGWMPPFSATDQKLFRFQKTGWRIAAAIVCLFLSAGGYYYWTSFALHESPSIPTEVRRQPVYESVDTFPHVPDSLPAGKKIKIKK